MVGKITPDYMASASIIPSIMGVNPYQSRNEVLRSCINASKGIERPAFEGNKRTEFGNVIEPFLAECACKVVNGSKLQTDFPDAYFHKSLELAASLDASCFSTALIKHNPEKGIYVMLPERKIQLSGTGLIECKNTGAAPSDEGPARYRGPLQLQAQLMCSGLSWGMVVTLYQGYDLRFYIYQADATVQKLIERTVTDFSERIKTEEFYPPTNSGDVNSIFPEPLAKEMTPLAELPVDVDEIVDDIIAARKIKKSMDEKIDGLQMQLKGALGNHEQGVTKNYHLTWKMRDAKPERLVTYKATPRERAGTVSFKQIKQDQAANG